MFPYAFLKVYSEIVYSERGTCISLAILINYGYAADLDEVGYGTTWEITYLWLLFYDFLGFCLDSMQIANAMLHMQYCVAQIHKYFTKASDSRKIPHKFWHEVWNLYKYATKLDRD